MDRTRPWDPVLDGQSLRDHHWVVSNPSVTDLREQLQRQIFAAATAAAKMVENNPGGSAVGAIAAFFSAPAVGALLGVPSEYFKGDK